MGPRHILESQQFNEESIAILFKDANRIQRGHYTFHDLLEGKILATLFYEPSTRTRLSFESAMLQLGGKVISAEHAGEFSSAMKGETLEDTVRVVGTYADAIVLRHPEEGAAKRAAAVSPVSIINGGDGKGQHPSQALTDLYTLYGEFARIEKLKIAFVGDLANGRTVRSLCYLLGKFKGNELVFVAPKNVRIGEDIKDYLRRHAVCFSEESNLEKILPEVDVIYMTRIQKERMNVEEYDMAQGKYRIAEKELSLMRSEARLLHPLPHVDEICLPMEVEQDDKRVAYFRQARNGLYVRMALLNDLLNRFK